MIKLIVNQFFLQQGIHWWQSESNWDRDFHNHFYERMYRLGSVNRSSWYTIVDELASWSALRPVPKDEIIKNGFQAIDKIDALIRQLMHNHDLGTTDFSQVDWDEILPIFQTANAIKNSSTPMFGSKLCHFILPKLFPVFDSFVGEKVGTNDYRTYWEKSREGWKNCTEKNVLAGVLQREIGNSVFRNYPWATKITELCCHGGGVSSVQNESSNDTQQRNTTRMYPVISHGPSSLKSRLKVGDVLISKKGRYHYVCISIVGNTAKIVWLNRKAGEPVVFYYYSRKIRASTAEMYYDVIPSEQVNRSMYETPKNGWPA